MVKIVGTAGTNALSRETEMQETHPPTIVHRADPPLVRAVLQVSLSVTGGMYATTLAMTLIVFAPEAGPWALTAALCVAFVASTLTIGTCLYSPNPAFRIAAWALGGAGLGIVVESFVLDYVGFSDLGCIILGLTGAVLGYRQMPPRTRGVRDNRLEFHVADKLPKEPPPSVAIVCVVLAFVSIYMLGGLVAGWLVGQDAECHPIAYLALCWVFPIVTASSAYGLWRGRAWGWWCAIVASTCGCLMILYGAWSVLDSGEHAESSGFLVTWSMLPAGMVVALLRFPARLWCRARA